MTEAPRDTANGKVGDRAALESVRRLEETLKDQRNAKEAARERIEAAREGAARIVREAREEALRAADEHRSKTLARADREAERLVGEAREASERIRALVEEDRSAAADEVIRWLVPGEES